MIGDWFLLKNGTMKTDPSLSSMCMHVVYMGRGMCKELVLRELGTSSKYKE